VNPRILLRADAGKQLGGGHVSRLCNIASHLAQRNIEFSFEVNASGRELIRNAGYSANLIDSNLEGSYGTFSHVVLDLCSTNNQLRVLDECRKFETLGLQVIVIDSVRPDAVGHMIEHSATKVIRPYFELEQSQQTLQSDSRFGGGDFVILGADFMRVTDAEISGPTRTILVTCGASDNSQLTLQILEALAYLPSSFTVTVVIGPFFTEALLKAIMFKVRNKKNFSLVQQPAKLFSLILEHLYVVGLPGLTRYEAFALGRYGIFFSPDSRYAEYYRGLQNAGLGKYFLGSDQFTREAFHKELIQTALNPSREINSNGLRLISRTGAVNALKAVQII
jgi:UDP-2,4-diacetamido-2,4,6-trideoxy-beta-L-altropyranose hydrolase